jgi:hypothetical protein
MTQNQKSSLAAKKSPPPKLKLKKGLTMQTTSKPSATVSNHKNEKTKTSADTFDISRMISSGGRSFLSTLKKKALRSSNSWFRLLSLDKRRFMDAVIQTVDEIRSSLLLKILTPLVTRLLQALGGIRGLQGNLSYGMQNFGQPLAQRISVIAHEWGNIHAAKWASDPGFIRFLTVIDLNDIPIFKVSRKI